VVDKTGTLTEGKPKLVAVEPAMGLTRTACCGSQQRSSAAANIPWRRLSSRAPRNVA